MRKTFLATTRKEAAGVYFFTGSNIGLTDSIRYHRTGVVSEPSEDKP
jgi:hypothetical protein